MSHASRGLRDSYGEALAEIGREEPRLVVIDADVAQATKAQLFAKAFPERFVQLGVAEQNVVSFAAGVAAVGGLIPLVNIFAVFASQRAADQVSVGAAHAELNVKIAGCYSGLSTPNTGATHQSIEDVAIMRAMPKFVVLEPADEVELKQVLRAGIAHEGPVYFRVARCPLPIIFGEDYRFEIGKSPVLREGKDVSLLGAGIMTSACLEAASLLEKEGLSAEVINVSTLKPLDEETLLRSAAKTRRVVTAENHSIIGGLGGAVAELLSCKLPTRLARVGIRDVFGRSGHLEDLLVEYHLTPQDVAAAARELMQSE